MNDQTKQEFIQATVSKHIALILAEVTKEAKEEIERQVRGNYVK